MERLFDRAFNKAHGVAHAVTGSIAAERERQKQQQQKSKEDVLRSLTTPMTAEDVVERIGMAYNDNDYFRLLQLAGPELDELGKAVWPVSSSELNKAYRKLSLLVHPDKAPGPEARQAFEQLKHAYNELKDPDKLAARLRDAQPALQKAAERAAATASVSEKVELNAAAEERRAKLRQQEARSFQQQIQEQMKRRAAEAASKKQRAAQSSRYRQQDSDGDGSNSDDGGGGRHKEEASKHNSRGGRRADEAGGGSSSNDDDNDDEVRRAKLTKRKKPRFM